jgi:hypothetical protein
MITSFYILIGYVIKPPVQILGGLYGFLSLIVGLIKLYFGITLPSIKNEMI